MKKQGREERVTIARDLAAQDVANHVQSARDVWPAESVAGYRYDSETGALVVTLRGDA